MTKQPKKHPPPQIRKQWFHNWSVFVNTADLTKVLSQIIVSSVMISILESVSMPKSVIKMAMPF